MRFPFRRRSADRKDAPSNQSVFDAYVQSGPSAGNAVQIFKGEWASQLPKPFDTVSAGSTPLFEDHRITWALGLLGDIRGTRVLELGPLEGGHSYMLDRAGAASVLAIEGNTHAYLRCLIAKELLGMPSVHFACGDFMEFLRESADRFDLCLASGVLYHMQRPVELIERIAAIAPTIFLWTHYYDADRLKASIRTVRRVVEPSPAQHSGFSHQLYRQEYGENLQCAGFYGSNRPFSFWLRREDILDALRFFGFRRIEIGCEQPDHPHGPALALVAWKQ